MKRVICVTLLLVIGFICFSCAGMSTEQRKESYDLQSSVGNKPFVGDSSVEAKELAQGVGRL